jgi:hypothetical protein
MDADLGRIEHANTKDIAMTGGPGADDLGEEGHANAHQFACLAALEGLLLCLLFGPQGWIIHSIHHLLHGGMIVAAVIFPAERRVIWELLGFDEVLHPQLDGIHAELCIIRIGQECFDFGDVCRLRKLSPASSTR